MNFKAELDLSTILQCIQVLGFVLGYFYIRPLRRSQARVGQLEQKLNDQNIDGIRSIVQDYNSRLRAIEENCPAHVGEAKAIIEERVTFVREAEASARKKLHEELGIMNRELGELRVEAKNQNGWLKTIDERVADVSAGLANISGQIEHVRRNQ